MTDKITVERQTIINRDYWNELAKLHLDSEDYPIDQVINGGSTLRSVELDILGDISNQRLLHAHCHIGLDTISLARTAKLVLGVDFSPKSVEVATDLAFRANIKNVSFLERDCQDLHRDRRTRDFDLYYAAYGVLVWVSDLTTWFKEAYQALKPGGRLILIDEHPVSAMFSGDRQHTDIVMDAPYFEHLGPYLTRNQVSYTGDAHSSEVATQVKWPHSISEIFRAFSSSGFELQEFQEYGHAHYNAVSNMDACADGYYRHRKYGENVPFMFSLVLAKKGNINAN